LCKLFALEISFVFLVKIQLQEHAALETAHASGFEHNAAE
jgi:hypothetical protein